MEIQVPVNHHFTPVFYLKAWGGADGRVIRYSRPRDVVVAKPCAPSRTGSEPHLYTLHGVPPERQAALETGFFSPVDSNAALAHAILLKRGPDALTPEQRCDWARFMLSMQLRSPFSLGEVERLADHVMRNTMQVDDEEFNALRKPGDPDTIYDWTAVHQPHVISNAHKTFLPAMIDNPELGLLLVNMHWEVVDLSRATHSLLTSDRPFISSDGWKRPRAVLAFPLDPTHLFIATHGPQQAANLRRKSPNEIVRSVNHDVVGCAVDFVIGWDRHHLAFVERRLRYSDDEPVPGPAGKGQPGCPP